MLGECAHAQRDDQQAESYYLQSAAIRQQLGDRRAAAAQYNNTSGAALAVGAFDRAAALCHEALQAFAEIGWPQGVAWALVRTSGIMFAQEQFADAAQVLSAATQLHASLGMGSELQPDDELRVHQLRTTLGEATFTACWAAGQTLSVDDAIALALGA